MTLRRRIVAGVVAIIAICLGVAFLTIHNRVDSQLTAGIDSDLRADMDAFASAVKRGSDPERYVRSQPFRSTARLLYAARTGRHPLTNEPDLLDADDAAIFQTAPGLSTVPVKGVGHLRLLVRRGPDGTLLGVGEPLGTVGRALRGVDNALIAAGGFALIVAILAGIGLSVGVTRPLRRMAHIAGAVDAGDLTPRMAVDGPNDEVARLALAFDTMLDRLEEAFRSQRVFVAEASHELRTPLTVIRGQLEVLAAQADPGRADIVRVERLVTAEVAHMSRLVDDLLVLAAPAVRPRDLDLVPFLTDLVDALRVTADRRLQLGGVSDATVRADPERLGQAVRNVVRNAIEHTAPGGRIRVTGHARDGRVRIDVDDDGPGIAPDQRERVFDRFHRVEPSPASKGAGLGLAIVGAVAAAHDGRAWADASDLGGARLSIELPNAHAVAGTIT